jgi:hypothetical protein
LGQFLPTSATATPVCRLVDSSGASQCAAQHGTTQLDIRSSGPRTRAAARVYWRSCSFRHGTRHARGFRYSVADDRMRWPRTCPFRPRPPPAHVSPWGCRSRSRSCTPSLRLIERRMKQPITSGRLTRSQATLLSRHAEGPRATASDTRRAGQPRRSTGGSLRVSPPPDREPTGPSDVTAQIWTTMRAPRGAAFKIVREPVLAGSDMGRALRVGAGVTL